MSEKSLMTSDNYCLLTFPTTHSALQAEKVLEDRGLSFLIVPTPREVSTGCGLSVRFFCDDLDLITGTLKDNGITIKDIYRIEKGTAGNQVNPVTGCSN